MNEEARSITRAVGRLDIRYRILAGIAALVFVASIVLYTVSSFQSTSLTDYYHGRSSQMTWTTGRLVLARGSNTANTTCTIIPKHGHERRFQPPYKTNHSSFDDFINTEYVIVNPWFKGSAQVRCTGATEVWQGTASKLQTIVGSGLYKVISAVLFIVPLLPVLLRLSRKQRKRG